MWVIAVPLAFLLVRGLHWPIEPVLATVEAANLIKCVVGYFFVKSGRWIHNLARAVQAEEETQEQAAEG